MQFGNVSLVCLKKGNDNKNKEHGRRRQVKQNHDACELLRVCHKHLALLGNESGRMYEGWSTKNI